MGLLWNNAVNIASPNELATPMGCDRIVFTNAGGASAKKTMYSTKAVPTKISL
jgi:hypothetical protein